MNSAHKNKLAWVAATVGSVVLAGSVATASAHHGNDDQGNDNNGDHGYAKEQCMNGGWKNFTNPDGSQKFKNQGQCIAFFNHNGSGDSDNDQGNGNGHGNGNQQGDSGQFHFGSDMTSWMGNLFSWLSHLFGGA